MLARFSSFVMWALVAAVAVFWGLRLWVSPVSAPSYTVGVSDGAVIGAGDFSRLLGTTPAIAQAVALAPEASSRFQLVGTMAAKPVSVTGQTSHGLALIAVDGKPAKVFAVGATLDEGILLQSVGLRTAALGPAGGSAAVSLELPVLPVASTGKLPSALTTDSAVIRHSSPPPGVPPPPMAGESAGGPMSRNTPAPPASAASQGVEAAVVREPQSPRAE